MIQLRVKRDMKAMARQLGPCHHVNCNGGRENGEWCCQWRVQHVSDIDGEGRALGPTLRLKGFHHTFKCLLRVCAFGSPGHFKYTPVAWRDAEDLLVEISQIRTLL